MLTSWICFCVSFCAPAGSSLAGRWTRERLFPVTLPCLALCMSLAVIVGLTPGISRRFQSVGCGGARLGPEISTLSLAWTARPKHRYNYLCSSSVMLSDMSKTYRLNTHHTHMHNQAHGTCTQVHVPHLWQVASYPTGPPIPSLQLPATCLKRQSRSCAYKYDTAEPRRQMNLGTPAVSLV